LIDNNKVQLYFYTVINKMWPYYDINLDNLYRFSDLPYNKSTCSHGCITAAFLNRRSADNHRAATQFMWIHKL